MTAPHILVFAGSLRTGSFNEKLAVAAAEAIGAAGGEVERISLSDYPMPIYHGDIEKNDGVPASAQRLGDLFMRSNGIFIACPEHNAGPTALLKNTIDWLSRVKAPDGEPGPFKGRVFALGAASPGGFGGYRGLMQVRQSLELQLAALLVPEMVSVPQAMNAFGEDGKLTAERPVAMLKSLAERLVEMAGRHT
jgi:chromate reductase, NAD(P)H dehydrogenase (quinone)